MYSASGRQLRRQKQQQQLPQQWWKRFQTYIREWNWKQTWKHEALLYKFIREWEEVQTNLIPLLQVSKSTFCWAFKLEWLSCWLSCIFQQSCSSLQGSCRPGVTRHDGPPGCVLPGSDLEPAALAPQQGCCRPRPPNARPGGTPWRNAG